MNTTYLHLRSSLTGKIVDTLRLELNEHTQSTLERLGRRNGYDVSVMLDGYYTSTYNHILFDNLKHFYGVDYATGTKRGFYTNMPRYRGPKYARKAV